jgi:4-amino-4-deoxy-L-arabinose transferase-like glycosyltransferase
MPMKPTRKLLYFILALGFVLRLLVALTNDPMQPYVLGGSGGDEMWYLANGLGMFSGTDFATIYGLRVSPAALPTAPLYLLFIGGMQLLFPQAMAVVVIWITQCIAGTITCYFAYGITRRLAADEQAGLIAAAILVFSLAFILEAHVIVTETLYIFFIVGGIWAYVRAVDETLDWRWLALCAVLLALATLPRAISLLFPIGLAGLLILTQLRQNWKQGLLAALFLVGIYAAICSTWTLYNWVAYNRLVIGSDQLMPSFWRGAVEGDTSPEANDAMLGDETHSEQAAEIIASDPTGYVERRVWELANSYLQPYGTIGLGDESLKAMVQAWMQSGFSLNGLWQLITGEGFWSKLLIYIWHFGGLLLGVIGMWLTRKNWTISLALVGFIVYTTLFHLVILALPRYIFPTLIFYWMFAAVTLKSLDLRHVWQLIRRTKP